MTGKNEGKGKWTMRTIGCVTSHSPSILQCGQGRLLTEYLYTIRHTFSSGKDIHNDVLVRSISGLRTRPLYLRYVVLVWVSFVQITNQVFSINLFLFPKIFFIISYRYVSLSFQLFYIGPHQNTDLISVVTVEKVHQYYPSKCNDLILG